MGLFGRGNGKGVKPPVSDSVEIPSMIAERLMSEVDALVLSAIGAIMQDSKKYRASEVVERLAAVLQYPHGDEVVQKAGDALIEKLKNGIHYEDAEFIITSKLGKRSETNARLFVKMLDKLPHKPELKKLAVEMLASFRGVQLRPEFVDYVESALMERLMDSNESPEVRDAIRRRFGTQGKGRPEVRCEQPKGEATVALDKAGSAPEEYSSVSEARIRIQKDIPTQGIGTDIIKEFISQLSTGDAVMKKRADLTLRKMIEGYSETRNRKQLEKIRDGVEPLRAEFPDLYRHVLKAMQGVLPEGTPTKPPIAVSPSGEARRLGDKDPTPVTPVKAR